MNKFTLINHQTGLVTEALLHWWFRRTPEDEQGLPDQLKPLFTKLCDTKIDKFRHGRVLLAAHIIALFRVDRDWTMQHLLPLFDWQHSKEEARAAWPGFLSTPRLYRPLMEVLKPEFLDTARHYAELEKYAGQYASMLTFAALDPGRHVHRCRTGRCHPCATSGWSVRGSPSTGSNA